MTLKKKGIFEQNNFICSVRREIQIVINITKTQNHSSETANETVGALIVLGSCAN